MHSENKTVNQHTASILPCITALLPILDQFVSLLDHSGPGVGQIRSGIDIGIIEQLHGSVRDEIEALVISMVLSWPHNTDGTACGIADGQISLVNYHEVICVDLIEGN